MSAFSSCDKQEPLFAAVGGLLVGGGPLAGAQAPGAGAPVVAVHGSRTWAHVDTGSWCGHRLRSPSGCAVFPEQVSNHMPCTGWQVLNDGNTRAFLR